MDKIILLIIIFINFIYADIFKIGVLAKRGTENALNQWQPTAEYLTEKIDGHEFKIIPLDFNEIFIAIRQKEIDFVLSNSAIFIMLEHFYKVRPIVTMQKEEILNKPTSLFGGVIFTKADRLDLRHLNDLKNKLFGAVDKNSFGGWHMAYREFLEKDIDPFKDFTKIKFLQTHDRVVEAVKNGEIDAGTVRSGTLEAMAKEGKININDFYIFNLYDRDFPLLITTKLYPEWPFAKLPFVSEEISKKVAIALLQMSDEKALKASKIKGWITPLNYESVDECLKFLKLPPYQDFGKITLTDIYQKYKLVIIFSGFFLIIITLLLIYALKLNKKLKYKNIKISHFNQTLEESVKEKTEELKENRDFLKNISDGMGEGIIVISKDGKGVYANLAVEKILGYEKREIIGEDIHNLIHYLKQNGEPFDKSECMIHNMLEEKIYFKTIEDTFIKKDGTKINVLINNTPIKKDKKIEAVISVFQDITKRKSYEKNLIEKQKEIENLLKNEKYLHSILKMVADINQLLIISTSLSELLKKSCNRLVQYDYYELVCIHLLKGNKLKLYIHSKDKSNYLTKELMKKIRINEEFAPHPAIKSATFGEEIIINDIEVDERFKLYKNEMLKAGFTSLVSLPLQSDKFSNPIGSIIVYSNREGGFEAQEFRMLIELAGDIGFAVNSFKQREIVESLEREKFKNYEETIYTFVNMIEQRDTYTAGHTLRVAKYSKMIAQALNFPEGEIEKLYKSAILHDIGKIATPDAILLKPSKLNNLEYELIKEHVIVGYEMLSKIDMYKELAEIMKYHHERYDGRGYMGKKGEEVPLLSHILIISDAFDAMTTNRIYKGRKSVKEALKEMVELSGKQFHPIVVDVANRVLKDIEIDLNISQLPNSKVERERLSYFFKDQLTELYNRDYLLILLKNTFDYVKFKSMYFIYLHNFNKYNQTIGWEAGNTLLKDFASYLSNNFSETLSFIFRVRGDDFVILSKEELEIPKESELEKNSPLFNTVVTLEVEKVNLEVQRDEIINMFENLNF